MITLIDKDTTSEKQEPNDTSECSDRILLPYYDSFHHLFILFLYFLMFEDTGFYVRQITLFPDWLWSLLSDTTVSSKDIFVVNT